MSKQINVPTFTPLPDWLPYSSPYPDSGPGFVTDYVGSQSLRSKYFLTADKTLVGKAWFGPLAKGPPGHAHGGSQAALLDDAMGTAAWVKEIPVVAVHIDIDFKKMLPLQTEVFLEARIEKQEGRKVFVSGRIYSEDGQDFAVGRGIFVKLTDAQLQNVMTHAPQQP